MPNFLNYFRKGTPQIFVCYRRKDSESQIRHLYDNLESYFNQKKVKVFLDDTSLKGGDRYKVFIQNAIRSSSVFLVVIGNIWVEIEDSKTKVRRLDEANDFVKKEIKSAIDIDIPIIPVVLYGAKMPVEDDLPDELKKLAEFHAVEFGSKWSDSVKELIGVIEEKLEQSDYSLDYRKIIITAVLISIIGIAGWGLFQNFTSGAGNSNTNSNTGNYNTNVVTANVNNSGTPTPVPILLPTIEPPVKGCKTNTPLPENDAVYLRYIKKRDDQWGCELTIRAIEKLAEAWNKEHPGILIQIGDISREGGAPPNGTEDKGHRGGIAFDIRPLRGDNLYEAIEIGKRDYSKELNRALVILIKGKLPNAIIYFDDEELEKKGLVKYRGDVYNHLHIELH